MTRIYHPPTLSNQTIRLEPDIFFKFLFSLNSQKQQYVMSGSEPIVKAESRQLFRLRCGEDLPTQVLTQDPEA